MKGAGPGPGWPGVRPKRRHRWTLTPREAIALQERMRSRLVLSGGPRAPRLIAGADVAYDPKSGLCFAAVVVMRSPGMEIVECATAEGRTSFPYVPGLLTFREGPIVLRALAKLTVRPDLIIFDGQGFAHPRRFGLASHMGYILDMPSIGCAKSILIGEHERLGPNAGSFAWLRDKGERIGAAVRTRDGIRPVYVSPGHRVGLRAAIRLALSAVTRFRVPEPTRIADILVEKLKREHCAEAVNRAQPGRRTAGPAAHRFDHGAGYSPVSRKRT